MEEIYELVDRKTVPDSDGFLTDYSWYVNTDTGEHVMVFGDSELYTPEDGYFDAEFETEDEAQEWFDSYNGFEDDEEDIEMESFKRSKTVRIKRNESTTPDHRKASRFMYKGYICAKCEDGFRIYTTQEWQYGKDLRLSEATVADEEAAKNWIDDALMGGKGITIPEKDMAKDEGKNKTEKKSIRTAKKESLFTDDLEFTEDNSWVQSYGVDILVNEDMQYTDNIMRQALKRAGLKVVGLLEQDGWDLDEYKRTTGINALESNKRMKKEGTSSKDFEKELHDAIYSVASKWIDYIGDADQLSMILTEIVDDVCNELFELDECTNSSSIGQHKKSSIDLIDESREKAPEDLVIKVMGALDNEKIWNRQRDHGKNYDFIVVARKDLDRASEIRDKIDPERKVIVASQA